MGVALIGGGGRIAGPKAVDLHVIIEQTCHAFKGCSSSPRLLCYSFTVSATIILMHLVPGHELGAAAISSLLMLLYLLWMIWPSRLGGFICMDVTAEAYILTLFDLKYREQVHGLVLISPLCQSPSWTEWFYDKVVVNLLYFYVMCAIVKESLL